MVAATRSAEPEPLLAGSLAERARDALDDLSRALSAFDASTVQEPSLASGTGGLALAHACLAALFPDRPHAEVSQQALDRTIALAAKWVAPPWLFQGSAGVGWLVEHLAGDDDASSDATTEVERLAVGTLVQPGDRPWELMHGTAGLAVYALERRSSRASARALLQRVGRHLLGAAPWLSDPKWGGRHAAPYVNFGFAHGVPGALAVAAVLVEQDVLADPLRSVVRDAGFRLLSQRLPTESDGWFRSHSDDDGRAARTGWCYGDPGVAWALMVAGHALGDRELTEQAIAVAEHAARRPAAATSVIDPGLCHGAAGLAHLYHRMWRLHPYRSELRDAARKWFWRLLDMRSTRAPLGGFKAYSMRGAGRRGPKPVWNDDPSLLNGAAGVALALASALEPSVCGWDAPFLGRPA